MHMDVTKRYKSFTVAYFTLVALLCLIYIILWLGRISPSAIGGSLLVSILMFRPFFPDGWLFQEDYKGMRSALELNGVVFLLFTYISSKAIIILFLYKCRTLRRWEKIQFFKFLEMNRLCFWAYISVWFFAALDHFRFF